MPRKIIQISNAAAYDPNYECGIETLTALCNDGTVFNCVGEGEWQQINPIPQDGYVEIKRQSTGPK